MRTLEIIGHGFIAGNLHGLRGRHPGVTVLAAGVSRTSVTSPAEFARETRLVRETLRRCRADGHTAVFLSTASAAMYGTTRRPAAENDPVRPVSPYGRHKLALEHAVADSGADFLILRLSHLVGTGQHPDQLLPAMIAQLRSGSVQVYRGAYRDLLDVRHMVLILDGLLTLRARGMVVNVASGVPEPIERIVAELESRLGTRARREVVDVVNGRTEVSIAVLRSLLPQVGELAFGPTYLPTLLDHYVGPASVGGTDVKTVQQNRR